MKKTRVNSATRAKRRERTRRSGGADSPPPSLDNNVFMTKQISMDTNRERAFRPVGVVHYSESMAINALRDVGTGVMNMFGQKGFDNTIYDQLRTITLKTVQGLLKPNQKVCSSRMEFENDPAGGLIYHHFYGTLFERRAAA